MPLPDPSTPSTSSIFVRASWRSWRSWRLSLRVRSFFLAGGFAAIAVVMPLCFHTTEAGNVAWAWFLFFALQAVLVLSNPSIFLAS